MDTTTAERPEPPSPAFDRILIRYDRDDYGDTVVVKLSGPGQVVRLYLDRLALKRLVDACLRELQVDDEFVEIPWSEIEKAAAK